MFGASYSEAGDKSVDMEQPEASAESILDRGAVVGRICEAFQPRALDFEP